MAFSKTAHIQITHPDFYKTVCIELDLVGLTVNTILQSSFINELEGTLLNLESSTVESSTNNPDNQVKSFDDTASCAKAFRMIKALVTGWSKDFAITTSKSANPDEDYSVVPTDVLLTHFMRWISSPHSKLYDPSVHRLIYNLTKKVFYQLLAEFKKLGSKIIFASFHKVRNFCFSFHVLTRTFAFRLLSTLRKLIIRERRAT